MTETEIKAVIDRMTADGVQAELTAKALSELGDASHQYHRGFAVAMEHAARMLTRAQNPAEIDAAIRRP